MEPQARSGATSQQVAPTATAPARIFLEGESGWFQADRYELTPGWVSATGCWASKTGANYSEVLYRRRVSRVWPTRRVRDIRPGVTR